MKPRRRRESVRSHGEERADQAREAQTRPEQLRNGRERQDNDRHQKIKNVSGNEQSGGLETVSPRAVNLTNATRAAANACGFHSIRRVNDGKRGRHVRETANRYVNRTNRRRAAVAHGKPGAE